MARESSDWLGTVGEGVQGAADQFVRVFAVGNDATATDVSITVSGIADLAAYARVTDYLESMALIGDVAVEQLDGRHGRLSRASARRRGARCAGHRAGQPPAVCGCWRSTESRPAL